MEVFTSKKKLGFGLMRLPLTNPDDKGSVDIEEMKKMVDSFMEQGFTYFDTAWMYCSFKSETAVKEALTSRHPRDSYTLASKLHCAFLKEKEDRDRIFNEQLSKTGVDFFDYYLIHDIEKPHYEAYEKLDCFNWLREKKEAGLVKHMGFSFHDDAEFLDKVLTEHPEMEFVQIQLNYLDWESDDVQSRKCYEVCEKHNKPVIVMEPVKGGKLADVIPAVETLLKGANSELSIPSWAIRFAASQKNVKIVLSGMSNMAQLLDNTGYMKEFKPLSAEEKKLLLQAAEMIKKNITIPCTGCAYCVDDCPMNIPIPQYFALYNEEKAPEKPEGYEPKQAAYAKLTETFGAASECLKCGQCEGICPQHLPVIKYLEEVSGYFGK